MKGKTQKVKDTNNTVEGEEVFPCEHGVASFPGHFFVLHLF